MTRIIGKKGFKGHDQGGFDKVLVAEIDIALEKSLNGKNGQKTNELATDISDEIDYVIGDL